MTLGLFPTSTQIISELLEIKGFTLIYLTIRQSMITEKVTMTIFEINIETARVTHRKDDLYLTSPTLDFPCYHHL